MGSSKHTPGPWRVRPEAANWRAVCDALGCSAYEAVLSDDTAVALVVAHGSRPGNVPPTNHNARLIAAAPELLEALRKLLADAENVRRVMLREAGIGMVDENALDAARAAIAKAEGK